MSLLFEEFVSTVMELMLLTNGNKMLAATYGL